MESGHVSVETTSAVATIRFGHPKGNSLPGALLAQIAATIDAAAADPESRVIVLRSNEPGPFCAGASFDELKSIADAETGKEFFMGFARVVLAMRRCPKLIVARVHGKIVGGGVGIVAAADFAVATAQASVKLSELAIGIGPFVVGPVIERKIGLGAFQSLAVDASSWRDAAWAERHGLYAQIATDGSALDEAVSALAGRLARSNPDAMAKLKQVFWEGTDDWDVRLEERAAMSGTLVLSTFTRNAIAAFATR
jgi:methylglutaconyl-CoA hydratase